ncbi:hypothetical protein [Haloferax sulfurifontis]|uniref:Uncharacterized protein n=2 Tax=Haloferax sulfurifontis TaxID=255616 RepID=M0INZ3_9EURY|nr:hypothetical protein [Haloferax sulfurifontis]ELZ98450.1 hypothetical protein C441_01189 [Haloferax sulfurifontis ATCC BAA-897]GGC60031.1 hypothetical protein GCM10007209_22650 [Haloferax sulfurifontis]
MKMRRIFIVGVVLLGAVAVGGQFTGATLEDTEEITGTVSAGSDFGVTETDAETLETCDSADTDSESQTTATAEEQTDTDCTPAPDSTETKLQWSIGIDV